jgi:hypothetical protein
MPGKAEAPTAEAIEIRLHDVSQLFNTLDPFPFGERDLSSEAEAYIVGWAQDLPKDRQLRIVIHLPPERRPDNPDDIARAISAWFAARAKSESNAIALLFRDSRVAFLIGVVVLSGCLLLAWSLSQRFADGPLARIIQESFIIIGWVVIWRPAEMFLYDWVPLARRRKLFERLARATVAIH